jgi:hypothetical protein
MLMKSAVIKRVDLWSLFKMAFVLYATIGFICGLFYGMIFAFIGSLGAVLGEDVPGLGAVSGAIGIVVVPVMAVMIGVMGSVVVTIIGALYNFAARFVGGLKVTVDVTEIGPSAGYATTATPPAS